MKKILAIILASLMIFALVACNETEKETETPTTAPTEAPTEEPTEAPVVLDYANATELLTKVWNALSDEYKFMSFGGFMSEMVNNAPGGYPLDNADAVAELSSMLYFPAEEAGKLVSASSLLHGMMLNNFTCGAYQFADAETAQAMAQTLTDAILNAHFMCGFPEKVTTVVAPRNYVIVVIGLGEFCVDPFVEAAVAAVEGAEVFADQVIG